MPSERNTAPTTRRIRSMDGGALVVRILCSDFMAHSIPSVMVAQCELRDVGKSHAFLDRANLFHGVFETVIKLFMLNVAFAVVMRTKTTNRQLNRRKVRRILSRLARMEIAATTWTALCLPSMRACQGGVPGES